MAPPTSEAKDNGSEELIQDEKIEEKNFNMDRLRASLLAPRKLEVIEIEIDDDEDDEGDIDLHGSQAGKFFLPEIPPFKGSKIVSAESDDTFEEILDDDVEEVIEEEIVEEFVDEEYFEILEDEDPSNVTNVTNSSAVTPATPTSTVKKNPISPGKVHNGDSQDFGHSVAVTEDDVGDEGDEIDGDKPSAEEVAEAILYILRQEKAVENGHVSPEQADQILALPLSDMMDIMNHFELCDNNSAPIRWDLILAIVFSQDEDAVDADDDEEDTDLCDRDKSAPRSDKKDKRSRCVADEDSKLGGSHVSMGSDYVLEVGDGEGVASFTNHEGDLEYVEIEVFDDGIKRGVRRTASG